MMTAVQPLACMYVHIPCFELLQLRTGDNTQCLIAANCRRPCLQLCLGPPRLDNLEPIVDEMHAQFNDLEIADSAKVRSLMTAVQHPFNIVRCNTCSMMTAVQPHCHINVKSAIPTNGICIVILISEIKWSVLTKRECHAVGHWR